MSTCKLFKNGRTHVAGCVQADTAAQDIICFQEVFMKEDRYLLTEAAHDAKLKHSHFCEAGILHGELLLLSRFPILQVVRICNALQLLLVHSLNQGHQHVLARSSNVAAMDVLH